MFRETKQPHCKSRVYHITVEGKIDASWSEWLSNMRLVSRKEANEMIVTVLSGELPDQPALRSLLGRLWDLNLVVVSVQQVDPFLDQDKS